MDENYSALLIDIKKSKSYEIIMRNEVQEYLSKCIKLLNDIYRPMISCDVIFSAGDELQGLFTDPVAAVLYWRMLEFLVYPVQIRAGIGIGEWNVRIDGGLSTEQDGPAYHNSRTAIKEVYNRQMQRIRIKSNSEKDILSNHLLNSSMGFKSSQNNIQNMLQIVSEIMYPFVLEDKIIPIDNFAVKIFELKKSYKIEENIISPSTKKSKSRENSLNDAVICVQDKIPIIEKSLDAEDVVVRKGMNIHIANVMNKTRQNIDVVMRRGNILLIRGMDYMALQYIKNNYGELK